MENVELELEPELGDLPNFRLPQQNDFEDENVDNDEVSDAMMLPEALRNFFSHFHKKLQDKDIYEIHSLYEEGFNKFTEKYFKNCPWPAAEQIANLVGNDQLFLVLYKEMYYRHIYSKLQPDLTQRIESFENYVDLFEYILKNDKLDLPNQWLWDIIDEFIYQYQAFTQYRSKLKNKTPEELNYLKDNSEFWNISSVLYYLEAFVSKSKIVPLLQKEKQGQSIPSETWESGKGHVLTVLGYFSLIGLLRLHCLVGDYNLALKVLEPIDLTKKGAFAKVSACHITLYYYLGFCYLMMRRYKDAIRSFTTILVYIFRTKQFHTRSHQYDHLVKKNDQIYALLAIALSLCPQRIDEHVHTVLREKYNEKMQRMQKGDETAFEELFSYACPKFVAPFIPTYEDDPSTNYNQDAFRLQLKLFMVEVRQQKMVPTLRSYLKLYSTIPIAKLAKFLEVDENTLKVYLMTFKHKTRQLTWNGGEPANGGFSSASDVEFHIDQDMINIVDHKVTKRYGEFFLRHGQKFEEYVKDL